MTRPGIILAAGILACIAAAAASAQSADVPSAIAVGPDSTVYVTGSSMSPSGKSDFFTVRYDAQGRVLGQHRFTGAQAGPSIPRAITFSGADVVISGTSPIGQNGFDIVAVFYQPGMMVDAEQVPQVPVRLALEQSFPNPITRQREAVIIYQNPEAARVRLSIIDVSGKETAVLVDEERPSGRYAVTFDPSALSAGTYYYRLSSSRRTEVRKLVVVR